MFFFALLRAPRSSAVPASGGGFFPSLFSSDCFVFCGRLVALFEKSLLATACDYIVLDIVSNCSTNRNIELSTGRIGRVLALHPPSPPVFFMQILQESFDV